MQTLRGQKGPQEEDDSEPDSLLDIEGAFHVGYKGRMRVAGGSHPSRSTAYCSLNEAFEL
jgi:hypothetical protein